MPSFSIPPFLASISFRPFLTVKPLQPASLRIRSSTAAILPISLLTLSSTLSPLIVITCTRCPISTVLLQTSRLNHLEHLHQPGFSLYWVALAQVALKLEYIDSLILHFTESSMIAQTDLPIALTTSSCFISPFLILIKDLFWLSSPSQAVCIIIRSAPRISQQVSADSQE